MLPTPFRPIFSHLSSLIRLPFSHHSMTCRFPRHLIIRRFHITFFREVHKMHFTGRTWRPPYEAYSVIIQATSGCTYNRCRFCNLYRDERFRLSPMEEFEEDLAEIKRYQPNARRIFWTGADPFSMSYENLKLRTHLLANSVSNFFPLTHGFRRNAIPPSGSFSMSSIRRVKTR